MPDNPYNTSRIIGGIYRVGQVITTGGMLTTYTAYNRNTNDVVGLYVLEIPPTVSLNTAQQLLQPIERRRSIYSLHLIRVHNWGIENNRIYIATDPPRGVTLQHALDNENIDLRRAIDLTRQLAIGLKTLHEESVAGMDLRPQLITVDTVGVTDRVQIDDIGLRSLLQALGYISSQRGNDIGYLDPRYAPPEYINNGPIGIASDIYQVGLLLFTLVTGRLPFVGRTPAETGILQSTGRVPLMSQFTYDTPATLQQLVERALAKDSLRRFVSIDELLGALDAIQLPPRPALLDHMGAPREKETGPTSSPSVGLTAEMQHMDNDLTLRATIIQGKGPDAALPLTSVPTETGVFAYLCHEKKGTEPQRFAITQQNTIVGRLDPKRGVTPDIDLSSIDPTMTISRQHARIRFEGSFFYIEDLKSRNRTRLGELVLTPLKAELLQHGDTIFFGSVRLYLEVPGAVNIPRVKDRKES